MTIQLSVDVRNARLDAIETNIGTAAKLKIFDGTKPATCADADAGTCLVTMDLPSDWLAAASAGAKAKAGTWQDTSADNTGTADYFRIYDSALAACDIQGTVTVTGGGGDMTLDNININAAQVVTVTGFTLTDGNA
jgi:uncharacterized lipoprotein NlpE involved in copper resistance